MSYADDANAHFARVNGLMALYNAGMFDTLMEHFCDDVACFQPTIPGPEYETLRYSAGKDAYRRNLETFRMLFGPMTVVGVFATADSSSVMVVDGHGNPGTFSFEVTPERKVKRVFFHHQPTKKVA